MVFEIPFLRDFGFARVKYLQCRPIIYIERTLCRSRIVSAYFAPVRSRRGCKFSLEAEDAITHKSFSGSLGSSQQFLHPPSPARNTRPYPVHKKIVDCIPFLLGPSNNLDEENADFSYESSTQPGAVIRQQRNKRRTNIAIQRHCETSAQ